MSIADDLLALIDPWAALADGRAQLLAAIAAVSLDGPDLAETLGIADARDRAMHDVARAYIEGTRDFTTFAAPRDRVDIEAPHDAIARAEETRQALLESVAALGPVLDEFLETPWGGRDTWRMHLVTLAMHDGADAQSILARMD